MAAVLPQGRADAVRPDDAVADLFTRHADRVFRFCFRWLRSREDAEDAAQTTFLYALGGVRRGVVPELESAWLLTIARNVCLSRSETVARRRRRELPHDPQLLQDMVAAPETGETLESLAEALTELTEPQRRALLMREWRGLSYDEIAAELGVSRSAVETLLFRARRALSSRLRSLLSLAPWLRSFGAGGGAKLAAGAAVAVVTAAVGSAVVPARHAARPARVSGGVPVVAARAARPAAVASPVAHPERRTERHRVAAHVPTTTRVAPPPGRRDAAPAAALGAGTPASAGAEPPAAPSTPPVTAPTPTARPAPTPAPATTTTTVAATGTTETVTTAVATPSVPTATVTSTVDGAVDAATGTVSSVADPIAPSAAGAVDAAASAAKTAVQAAGSTVGTVVDTTTSALGSLAPPP